MRPFAFCVRCVLAVAVSITALNLLALAMRIPLPVAIAAVFFAVKNVGRWKVSDAHGSARASGLGDCLARGMLGGQGGLILGTTGYLDPPRLAEGLAALFNPALPSTLAVRFFLAGCFGKQWMKV